MWLLLAGLGAYYLTFPLRSLRWWLILRRVGSPIPYRDATEILFLSWFVNCLVPAKLGDLYRAYLLRANHGASISRTVGTIFLERITDIVVIFALALAAGFWSFRNRDRPEVDALFLAGFIVASLLVIFVVGAALPGPAHHRLPAGPGRRAVRALPRRQHRGPAAVAAAAGRPDHCRGVDRWRALRVFFVIRSLDLAALDLPALNLGISSSIFVALAASLLTAIPLTPAGIGFVQFGIVCTLSLYGVSNEAAAAVAVTDFLLSTLSVIVFGGILYAFSGMVRRAHGRRQRTAPLRPEISVPLGHWRPTGVTAILRLLGRTTGAPFRWAAGARNEPHDAPDAAVLQQLAAWPAEGKEDEPAPAGAPVRESTIRRSPG